MAKKMSVEEAAKYFGVSKEAIHNRVRRGTLQSIIEDGVKYVLVQNSQQKRSTSQQKKAMIAYEERFNSYLEEQNKELRQKIEQLENETRMLRQEKEQLLIEERKRIEKIYKEKDEQLKNILNAISSKFLLEAKPLDQEDHLEAEIEEKGHAPAIISLKKYLKSLDIPKKKKAKFLKRAKKIAKKDARFFIENKKIYLDTQSFSYEDLF